MKINCTFLCYVNIVTMNNYEFLKIHTKSTCRILNVTQQQCNFILLPQANLNSFSFI